MRINQIRLSLSWLFSIFLIMLSLGSCEKEEFTLTQNPNSNFSIRNGVTEKSSPLYEDVVLPVSTQENIKQYLLGTTQLNKSGQEKNKILQEHLDQLVSQPVREIDLTEFGDIGKVLTYFVPTESPTEIVNVVVQIDDDKAINGYINVYRMSPKFAVAFNNFTAKFQQFEGELIVQPLSEISNLWYESIEKNNNGSDCFTVIFNPSNDVNGGGGNNGSITGATDPWTGLNWGRFNGTVYVFGDSGGGDDTPNPTPTPGCVSEYRFTGKSTVLEGRHFDIYAYFDCDLGDFDPSKPTETRTPIENFNGGGTLYTTSTSKNKSLDSEGCVNLLKVIGVLPRQLSTPDDLTAYLQELIENAISKTCFNENAVMDMINPATFEACYDLGTPGPDCITEQVISYLNRQNYPSGSTSGDPLSISISFDGMSHDQLAPFLHAAVAANGNQHVLAGIYAARRNLSKDFINSNTPLQILLLSNLSMQASSEEAFFTLVGKYYALVELSTIELKNSHFTWMVNNMNDVDLLLDFNEQHSDFDIDLYLDIMEKHHGEVNLSRMLDNYVDWSTIEDGNTPILEFNNPVVLGPPEVYTSDFSSFQKVAALPVRPGYDETDMCTNCWDHALELVNGFTASEENHWITMRDLFELTTMGALDNVGETFIARFQDNLGGEFHHADLSRAVMQHESTRNTVRYFGNWFSARLTVTNGQIDFPTEDLNPNFRPRFPTSKASGLTILVNDTYKTDFRIIDIQVNQQSRTWNAVIGVEIHDHFGVDFEDALDTQDIHHGFSSWFQLQHQYNHKPFTSVMKFTIPVQGDY